MIVGLTGGVASGKSLVTGEFRRLGALVVDADVIAREVVEPGSPVFRALVEEFGPGSTNPDGTLNRGYVAAEAFSDREKLKRLNRITHPPIRRKIEEEIRRLELAHPGGVIVVDAALLIENGLHEKVDRVVVVYATESDQVERLVAREGMTPEEALRRLASQMPLGEKTRCADYVIDNTGDREATLAKARAVFDELRGEDKRA